MNLLGIFAKDKQPMSDYAKYGMEMDAILAEIAGHEADTKKHSEAAVVSHALRREAENKLAAKQAELVSALSSITAFLMALTKLPPLVLEVDASKKAEEDAARLVAEQAERQRQLEAEAAARLVAEEAERTRLAEIALAEAAIAAATEATRVAEEAERTRLAEAAAAEAENARIAAEQAQASAAEQENLAAEAARLEALAVAERQRDTEAAEALRIAEEARMAAEAALAAEQERDRLAQEAAAAAPSVDPLTGFGKPPL